MNQVLYAFHYRYGRRIEMNKANMRKKIIILIGLLSMFLLAVYGIVYYNRPKPQRISYNEFLEALNEHRIEKVYLTDSDTIKGVFKDKTLFITDNPRKEGFKEQLLINDIIVDETEQEERIVQIGNSLFLLAILGALVLFISRNSVGRTQGHMSKVGSMAIKPETNVKTSFRDVAGNDEALESMKEIIDFIKNPEKYARYGARLPRGVILYGPPGTGKTLLAKAVAGEAGVPFYAVSGSDFVQIYVGVGASRIRQLFDKAREAKKCVIFIDEIDAIGKKRDGGIEGGGNDERDQTLNALLSEMSGFQPNEGIVVIAATNRLDTLDEALLRPGRFDRHIEIGLPDVNARKEILKLHSENKPIGEDVNIEELAQQTVYFSGAKLESLMNEAAIFAARRNSGKVEKQDIDKAFYTVVAGFEKKDRSAISEEDRRVTAFHEAGHALITRLMTPENRVTKVTIIPSTKGAGGFSMSIPPDRQYYNKKNMEDSIRILLAGRAAEEIIFGEDNITTGAANDLERATETILNMVRRFGMKSNAGLLNYDVLYRNGMQQAQSDILDECKMSLAVLYDEVKSILIKNRTLLCLIAQELLEKETLNERDLDRILTSPCMVH